MKLKEIVLDFFFPRKCVFCRKVLNTRDICPDCMEKLPYTQGDSIVQQFPHIAKCVSPLYYKDAVREAVLRFKFMGLAVYARAFAQLMSECAENNLDCGDIDVISWVPLSRKRKRKRGYNQSELIAGFISRDLDIPAVPTLVKTVDNPAQSGTRSAAERAKNVRGVYEPAQGADIKGKAILIVDDVVTTGSTVSECARVLMQNGALRVYCVTLARRKD